MTMRTLLLRLPRWRIRSHHVHILPLGYFKNVTVSHSVFLCQHMLTFLIFVNGYTESYNLDWIFRLFTMTTNAAINTLGHPPPPNDDTVTNPTVNKQGSPRASQWPKHFTYSCVILDP